MLIVIFLLGSDIFIIFFIYLFDYVLFLLACVKEYFGEEEKDKETSDSSEDMIYDGYKTVLDSKSTDEALVSQLNRTFTSELKQTNKIIQEVLNYMRMCIWTGNVCKLGAKTYKTLS